VILLRIRNHPSSTMSARRLLRGGMGGKAIPPRVFANLFGPV
jgi:hypothetical protein